MVAKNKEKRLTAAQLSALPISVGEARKLLGADETISDEDVAQEILLLTELARVAIKSFGFAEIQL